MRMRMSGSGSQLLCVHQPARAAGKCAVTLDSRAKVRARRRSSGRHCPGQTPYICDSLSLVRGNSLKVPLMMSGAMPDRNTLKPRRLHSGRPPHQEDCVDAL